MSMCISKFKITASFLPYFPPVSINFHMPIRLVKRKHLFYNDIKIADWSVSDPYNGKVGQEQKGK